MLESNDFITCVEASRLYSSTYPDRPRLHPATIRTWCKNPKHPLISTKYRASFAVSRASFLKVCSEGWPKLAGARHPDHALAKAKAEAKAQVQTETVADAGYTAHLDEETTVKLVDVKRWIGAARLDGALRVCVERIHSEMKHVRKPADQPLVKLGNGDYTVEYREEDV